MYFYKRNAFKVILPPVLLTDKLLTHPTGLPVPLTLDHQPLLLSCNTTYLQRAVNAETLFSATQSRHSKTT